MEKEIKTADQIYNPNADHDWANFQDNYITSTELYHECIRYHFDIHYKDEIENEVITEDVSCQSKHLICDV